MFYTKPTHFPGTAITFPLLSDEYWGRALQQQSPAGHARLLPPCCKQGSSATRSSLCGGIWPTRLDTQRAQRGGRKRHKEQVSSLKVAWTAQNSDNEGWILKPMLTAYLLDFPVPISFTKTKPTFSQVLSILPSPDTFWIHSNVNKAKFYFILSYVGGGFFCLILVWGFFLVKLFLLILLKFMALCKSSWSGFRVTHRPEKSLLRINML